LTLETRKQARKTLDMFSSFEQPRMTCCPCASFKLNREAIFNKLHTMNSSLVAMAREHDGEQPKQPNPSKTCHEKLQLKRENAMKNQIKVESFSRSD
jgi:hypothetical protein